MEGAPQYEGGNEQPYDREAIASEAMERARGLMAERGINDIYGNERFEAMQDLMLELASDNANRHVVEALAQILTVDRAAHDYHIATEQFPRAVA